ncbi:hypothetical protein C8F04DRAFT_1294188 [Mycena alexandri]|uniref:F-box domain-containing protein n=1 Tax=Mycena alexandri TaxID=1745969 RepID=A0AAD6SI22_9AGAR|nr:hypothetical protein C8F04DRAFT_1294188 [Mycena alexandri]
MQSLDEDLLRAHEAKTALRLTETENSRRDLRTQIQQAKLQARKLLTKITTLERSETLLLRDKPDQRRSEKIKLVREKIGDAKSLLRMAEKEKETLVKQYQLILREIVALNTPITAEAFQASPIRRMPTDILVAIFMAVRPDDIQPAGKGPIPVLLEVCAEWRAVACAHPALWSAFSCSLFPGIGGPSIELVHLYLQRSKAAALTIEVDAGRQSGQKNEAEPMIDLLAVHAEWFYCVCLVGDWLTVDLHRLRGRLSRLEILQLPSMGARSSDEFEIAPWLRTLILRTGHTEEDLPFNQIHSLHLYAGVSVPYLSKFPHLAAMSCSFTEYGSFGAVLDSRTELAHLSSWTINFSNFNRLDLISRPKFFDAFAAPVLESLEISYLSQPSNLGGFVQRSGYNLKTLALQGSSVCIEELLQILKFSPSLTSFTMKDGATTTAITDRLLTALTVGADHNFNAFLPNLKHISIEGEYIFRDAVLVEMLESRTVSVLGNSGTYAALNTVELTLHRAVKEASVGRLRDLESVNVSLHCLDHDGELITVI